MVKIYGLASKTSIGVLSGDIYSCPMGSPLNYQYTQRNLQNRHFRATSFVLCKEVVLGD